MVQNKDVATLAELALMGKCVPVTEEQVNPITQYLLVTFKSMQPMGDIALSQFHSGWDVLSERIRKYTSTNDVAYITTSMVYDDPVIVYLLKSRATDEDEKFPDPFVEDYGTGYPCAFTYCLNPYEDYTCSEFGDAFFEKREDGYYHRVS